MRLKSFGCSFIFGTDLHDDGRHLPRPTASNYTWPALLAQHHGWDYHCYARGGAGNLEISTKLLNQLADAEPAVYVIGWTWIDRFTYTNGDIPLGWRSIMPVDDNAISEFYYKNLHSEFIDKLTTLIYIKTAIDSLLASGNKFIMTYMDDLMFDQQWHNSAATCNLQQYCRPYMTRFDNKTLLEYSKEHGFEISPTMHPLEPAHQAAFELINSYNLV